MQHLSKFKKIIAFTLAEVLITLGIIGIVAAITIPTLISASEKATLYSQFITSYSILNRASQMVITEMGGSLKGQFATLDDMALAFASQLKVTKKCLDSDGLTGGAYYGTCWNAGAKDNLNGTTSLAGFDPIPHTSGYSPVLFLQNGSIVVFSSQYFRTDCDNGAYYKDSRNVNHNYCNYLYVDTNGLNKPNRLGKDIIRFGIMADMPLVPIGIPGTSHYINNSGYDDDCNPSLSNTNNYNGETCGGKMFIEKKMDY